MDRVRDTAAARQERAEYVDAFNRTMVEIWKEQIVKLGVIDSGNLYGSVRLTHSAHDEKITEIDVSWQLAEYGVYQDRGPAARLRREIRAISAVRRSGNGVPGLRQKILCLVLQYQGFFRRESR